MRARRFNSIMPAVHESWVANVLGLEVNQGNGIDLLGERAIVEVKFLMVVPGKQYPQQWTVQEHQVAYPADDSRTPYWALGFYSIDREVEDIPGRTRSHATLENMVTERKVHIVPWDWIHNYKPSRCTGKTKISQWDNTFRYPKARELPGVIGTYQAGSATIHICEGVDESDFDIQVATAAA